MWYGPDLSQKLGFCGAKVPLPYGPGDGDAGMQRNIEHLQALRHSVGPHFPLMVDCYTGGTAAAPVATSCSEAGP